MNQYDILLKSSSIPKGTPISEFQLFIKKCEDYGLNPLRNEIFLLDKFIQGSGRRFFTCIGINGLRKKAHDTGEYKGSPTPLFDGLELSVFPKDKKTPRSCKTTVIRNECFYEYEVFFSEYVPMPITQIWEEKPFVMIAKVSEAMALRKAFPELSGLYIEEELDKLHSKEAMLLNTRDKINKSIKGGVDDLVNRICKP
jgi:phage recombination protein Bet